MKRNIWIVTLLLIISCQGITAQAKKWTLEDCITYAVKNNIGLRRQRLQNETAEANLLKSRMDMLPSLNSGADASVGFGRSIDPTTNLITFNRNLSNQYYVTSSLQLFNGFTTLNTISANKFLVKAGVETEKVTRNALIIDIMNEYYQVLYTRGLENASKSQFDLSEKQLVRMAKMVETGREAVSKQYELESQVSSDQLAYTVAKNTASQALTSLRQLLQIEPGAEFDILIPDLNNLLISDNNFKPDSIYYIAAQTLPRLKAIEFDLRASKKQIAAQRGSLLPSVTAGGALFTGYYLLINQSVDQESFRNQIKTNFNQGVSLTLEIPIFNRYNNGRNIRLAKIRKYDTELKLELEKNTLYTEIENACLNFNRGKDEYSAAASNFGYNKKSFEAVEKKFEAGLVDVTVYSAAKNTLFRAETEALRTKLQLLIRKLTIQFYSTGEYENILNN